MKKISSSSIAYIPASHENRINPGVLKKILLTHKDLLKGGRIQMINWAYLPKGKSFKPHYHEDMEEIFIIVSGKAKIIIGNKEDILEKGDAVIIPIRTIHKMKSLGSGDVNYLVIGISQGIGGKTVTLDENETD